MQLAQRVLALGAPRRTTASSMTSSWYSVARWVSSQTTAAGSTSGAPGVAEAARPAATSIGRNRFPPAAIRCRGRLADERVLAADRRDQLGLDVGQARGEGPPEGAARQPGRPIVDAGVAIRCRKRPPDALHGGAGSGHQPTKIAARSASSSTDPGTMPSSKRGQPRSPPATIVVGRPGIADGRAVGSAGAREPHQHDDPQVGERQHGAGQHGHHDQRPGHRSRSPPRTRRTSR